MRDLYSIKETCFRLSIGRTKAYQLINAGKLKRVHQGRGAYITRESIENYLKELNELAEST